MDVGHVNAVDWLFDRWYLQALPRRTAIYDLACKPRIIRAFQHAALPGDLGHASPRWRLPRALFLHRFRHLLRLQSVLFALETDPSAAALICLLLLLDFLPSYLFIALSSFSWVCWIAPNNAKVNQLFGVSHGLAMGILTFDWGQISFAGSPFTTPWWAAANGGFTIAFSYWFLVPILYVRPNCFCLLPFAFLFFLF